MSELIEPIAEAQKSGKILESTAENLRDFLGNHPGNGLYEEVVGELVDAGHWKELDNRFFQTLVFGTGGLRGRTIGLEVTRAERGSAGEGMPPEHPCVGTNAMNSFNVSRATQGLAAYLREAFRQSPEVERPAVCISHDTRYFSREFAEFAARIFRDSGCDVWLTESFRSTPQLSFAIRHTGAQAGVVLTASHNPPAYNGYKVYFEDGGQIVEPHASGIIAKVKEIHSEQWKPLPEAERGEIRMLGEELDREYSERLKEVILDPAVLGDSAGCAVVFSSLHGTGGVVIPGVLRSQGMEVAEVQEQAKPDGGFPTVDSPNPENQDAMAVALRQGEETGADLVMATDPDADRLGVAARQGERLVPLTGNQIGSVLAWHRLHTLFEQGVLNRENSSSAVLVKTLVTTDLQKAIAEDFGVACVETLTGFKFIGAKMQKYENALPDPIRAKYRGMGAEESRAELLRHSRWFVFGGEESYGYSGADFVRDKDANMAAIMVAEAAAFAKRRGTTLHGLLDEIYLRYGYFLERGESITMEGAEGAAKIRALMESYTNKPPSELGGKKVLERRNFREEEHFDSEGDPLPKESMLMLLLEGGGKVAVRPSGTEPKIKYYLFHREEAPPKDADPTTALAEMKQSAEASLDVLWEEIKAGANV